jgi:hypothetical protein
MVSCQFFEVPALFVGDDFIPNVFKAKNLGVTFSYNLNWGDHVSTICRKVYGALAGLRRLTDVTPFAVLMRLVVALVIPFFIYSDCVYFALDSYSLRKLTVAFNAYVRYVYRRRLFDHFSDVSNSILGCSLLIYMEFRLACFMISLMNGGRPRYLYDSSVFSRSERTLRINSPRLGTWLGLCWPVESGFGTCSQSQLGLPHHFRALNGLFVTFWGSRIEGCKWILLFFYYFFSFYTSVLQSLSESLFQFFS